MLRYEIAGGADTESLRKEVIKWIEDGLKPFGSVVYVPHQQWGSGGFGGMIESQFYQPMVGEDE